MTAIAAICRPGEIVIAADSRRLNPTNSAQTAVCKIRDPSMVESDIFVYEKRTKLVIADPAERKRWSAIGVRRLIRESSLSQAPVSNAIKGRPVRHQTLFIIRQTVARFTPETHRN